ncbi:MAG TPA: plastocyanin/azurin family copper-binding protein [Gemmatimonadales bacterium]|nr:plastocyanin/azurin family copper-binding protein [Gemmatimonadales bacterium]
MHRFLRASTGSLALLASVAGLAEGQRVHEISMEANRERENFRFVPAQITARPGDVLLFKTVSGSPHSVVFEAAGLSTRAHEALNGALNRRSGDLSSPLLSPDGAEYRIVVPALDPGNYAFFCLPHRAYDMRGILKIAK